MIFVDGLTVLRKGVGVCKVVGKDVRTILYFIRDRFSFIFEGEERLNLLLLWWTSLAMSARYFFFAERIHILMNCLFSRNVSNSTGLLQFLTFLQKVFSFRIAFARSPLIHGGWFGLHASTLLTKVLIVVKTRSFHNSQAASKSSWDAILTIPELKGSWCKAWLMASKFSTLEFVT